LGQLTQGGGDHPSINDYQLFIAYPLFSTRGIPVLRATCLACVDSFFFIFNDPLSKAISGSIKPIFTSFSPYGRYLIVDYRSTVFFRSLKLRDVAMATKFGVKMGEIGRLIFNCRLGIPKQLEISPF